MRTVFLVFVFVLLFFGCTQTQMSQTTPLANYPLEVYFCPEDNCATQLIEKIDSARSSIDIAIYSFTLDEIADALIAAKERGVKVRVVFDASQAANRYSEDERLVSGGFDIKVYDKSSGIMHNKFIVIDSSIVGTGSFNYSQNADRFNDENLLFLYDPATVKEYAQEFDELWQEA